MGISSTFERQDALDSTKLFPFNDQPHTRFLGNWLVNIGSNAKEFPHSAIASNATLLLYLPELFAIGLKRFHDHTQV
jgi:hypothetical protein